MGHLKVLLDNIVSLESQLQASYEQLGCEKDNMFSSIVDITSNFIAVIQDEKLVFINPAGFKLLRCSTESDIIGKSIFEILHPDLHHTIREQFKNLKGDKANSPIHIKLLKANGEHASIEANLLPFVYNNTPAVLIAGHDISNELLHRQKKEEEAKLRDTVLNSFPELIAFYEPDHKIRWMNSAAKKQYGITDNSYIGKHCFRVRFNSDKPCSGCPMYTGEKEIHERLVQDKDIIWRVRHTPIFNSQGEISGYIELSTDVTQKEKRKAKLIEAEKSLRESEQRFREIFENSNDSIFLLEVMDDMRFRNLDCNPAFEKSTGLKRIDLVGKCTDETVPEEASKKPNEVYRRCAETGEAIIDKEIELKLPIGTRYYSSSIIPIPDLNGKVYRILGITRDITERKQLELLLNKKQSNLEEAQRIGKIGSWELNYQTGNIERSNEIFRIYEIDNKLDNCSKDVFLSMIHPADREKVHTLYNEPLKSKRKNKNTCTTEYRLLFPDGRIKYIFESCETHCDAQGNPLRTVGTVQDISEHKQNLHKIELLGLAIDNTSDAVFIRETTDEHFLYVNKQACKSVGYTNEELQHLTVFDIDPDISKEDIARRHSEVAKYNFSSFETRHKRKDGSLFPVEVSTIFINYDDKCYVMNHVRDITAQKQYQQKLEMLTQALNNTGEASYIFEKGKPAFIYFNNSACKMLGYSREELFEKNLFDIAPNFPPEKMQSFHALLEKQGSFIFEAIHKRKDGTTFPVESTISFYNYNNTDYLITLVRDITERKQMEEALAKRERDFRTLAENAPDPIYRYDSQCRRVYVNPVVEKVGKIPIASLLGKTPADGGIVSSSESMKVLNSIRKVLETGERDVIDVLFVFPDGRELWTQNIHVPEFGPDGTVESVLSIGRDITERKQLEQHLKDSFLFIETIINSLPEPIFVKDRQHRFVLSNNAHNKFRNLKREDFIGKSDFDHFTEQEAKLFWEDEECIFETGNETQYDDYHIDAEGNPFHFVLRKVSFTGSDGNKYLAGTIHDITQRKIAEMALRESEEKFSTVFKLSPASLAITRLKDHVFIDVNDIFLRNTRLSREKVVGFNQYEINLGIDISTFEPLRTMGDVQNFEYNFLNSEGKKEYGLLSLAIISIGGEQCVLSQSVMITELKNKQNELTEALKRLKESEQRYREVFNNSHDSIFLLEVIDGPHFRLLDVNPQYEREVGIDREKHIGRFMEENVTPDVAAIINEEYKRCLNAGTIIEETVELNMPQGLRIYHSVLAPIRDNSGKIYRIMGITRDVTEEIKAKRELETNRQRLQKAELIASIGHIEFDYKKDMNYWSNGAYEILNVPQVLRRPGHEGFRDLIHPDDSERVNTALSKATNELLKFDEIYRIIDFNGKEKVIHGTGQVQMDKNGTPGNFFCIIQDITLMYNLNAKLFAEEEKFRHLAESSPVGIYLSISEKPVYANKQLLLMAGISSIEELSTANLIDTIIPEDKIKVHLLTEKINNDQAGSPPYKLTLRKLSENNSIRYFDIHVTRFKIHELEYIQFIVIDITEDYENERTRQQLAASALYLEQKNRFASDIESTLKVILSSNKKFDRVDFQPVIDILRSFSMADKDWELLNNHIESIHPEFVSTLKKHCSSLSVNDIKHCACIRMNLDTKEIARFFNVKPSSIQTSRVRLKKKFNLPESMDLREFILSI